MIEEGADLTGLYRDRIKALGVAHEKFVNRFSKDAKARASASKALKRFADLPTDENADAYRLARLAVLASEAATFRARAEFEAAMEELDEVTALIRAA
jgi:hypothetical protein